MATEPTDKATAPVGASETTSAGGASETEDPKVALDQARAEAAAAKAEAAAARQQAEHAARLAHKRDTEIAELRRRTQDTGEETQTADPNAAIMARQDLIDFKLDHPDWKEMWPEMVKAAADPEFAMIHRGAPESRATLEAAYKQAKHDALVKEHETLKADKEKLAQARQVAADNAFVSGQGASAGQVTISEKELAGMTAKQMEEKFGKAALLEGLR